MKIINFGFIKIKSTLNNIFITLTDQDGNVLISKHSGSLQFKGSKKKTPYVAGLVLKQVFQEFNDLNIKIKCYILQVQNNTKSSVLRNVVKSISSLRMNNIIYIEHLNSVRHGNIRLKKQRRL